MSFDLTQVDDQGRVTTRYELTPEEQAALQYVQEKGVLIVASAGNTGDKMSALGQAAELFTNLLIVGAVNRWEEKADYSAQGKTLSLVAPGGQWESDPEAFVGTSKAAAYVTAGASRVWAANPNLNYQQIKQIILETADDLATPGWDPQTGAGLLDIEEAILTAQQTQGQLVEKGPPLPITLYSGEGRVSPDLRPNASNAVKGSLEVLEASQAQILNEWDQLRQLGSSDAPIEELAQELQARTETTLDLYQELTTLAAVAAAAEQQELEKYNLLDAQRNLRVQKITKLGQQLGAVESQKLQLEQLANANPEDTDIEFQQKFDEISEEINSIIKEIDVESVPISYWQNIVNGSAAPAGSIYTYRDGRWGWFKHVKSDFRKTTVFREAEFSEIEALKLKVDFIKDRQILNNQIQAFEREKSLSIIALLDETIDDLLDKINLEQEKLGKLDAEQVEIVSQLNLLREQLNASIQDIQKLLNVLGLGLPAKQLQEEFESVNTQIEERLNSIELNPDALSKLRKIRDTNNVKVAVLANPELQGLIQNQEFHQLIETISAEELERLIIYLTDESPANSNLDEVGQTLSSLLSASTGNKAEILEVLSFIEALKFGEEQYADKQSSWQSQEAEFASEQSSFVEDLTNDALGKEPLVDVLSELVKEKEVLDLLSQLNTLVAEEIRLAVEEDVYHEQATSAADEIWYTDGGESFYNASKAASYLEFQQSASEIAHQRNLNWQARIGILEQLSDLGIYTIDSLEISQLIEPDQQTQLLDSIDKKERLVAQLEDNLVEQLAATDSESNDKLAELQSFEAGVGNLATTAQELSQAAIESLSSLTDYVEFGTIASIYDVDYFENYVEPQVRDTQLSLEQQQQVIEERLAEAKQVLEILVDNTASAEEIDFLRNPVLQNVEIPADVANALEAEANFLEGIVGATEQLTGYIENLEQSQTEIESAISGLQASVSQAGIALAILRQKQEYDFRQQVARNEEALELFRAQAESEADINEGSILGYAKAQDRLREEIRKSVLNDSEALILEDAIRKGFVEQWADYQGLVDSTLKFVEDNLAEPHNRYQENLNNYENTLITLGTQTEGEIQAQSVINKLWRDIQEQKFEFENDSELWKEIAFLLNQYDFEFPNGIDLADLELEILEQLPTWKANTPELKQLRELQLEFVQNPEVINALKRLLQQKNIRHGELFEEFFAWSAIRASHNQPASMNDFFYLSDEIGIEFKQIIKERNELIAILDVIFENTEQQSLANTIDDFFSETAGLSSSYASGLSDKINQSFYAGVDAKVYEISKSFALPLITNEEIKRLDRLTIERVNEISEELSDYQEKADMYWEEAKSKYRDAELARQRELDFLNRSNDLFSRQLEKHWEKYGDKSKDIITSRVVEDKVAHHNLRAYIATDENSFDRKWVEIERDLIYYSKSNAYAVTYLYVDDEGKQKRYANIVGPIVRVGDMFPDDPDRNTPFAYYANSYFTDGSRSFHDIQISDSIRDGITHWTFGHRSKTQFADPFADDARREKALSSNLQR